MLEIQLDKVLSCGLRIQLKLEDGDVICQQTRSLL